ncbi:MAG TPA: hypothetical protein VFS65_01155 [Candidatus Saccharimonadales bacterium]|nr:hypothetical protein [Candidatus Saccharimonadales bacterium]
MTQVTRLRAKQERHLVSSRMYEKRNKRTAMWITASVLTAIAFWLAAPVGFHVLNFPYLLPLIMMSGILLVGIWLFASNQLNARRKSKREAAKQRSIANTWAAWSLVIAAIIGIGGSLVTHFTNTWDGYTFLTSGGMISFTLLGMLPIVGYLFAIARLLNRKKSIWLTILFAIISLLGPYFASSWYVYTLYHVM